MKNYVKSWWDWQIASHFMTIVIWRKIWNQNFCLENLVKSYIEMFYTFSFYKNTFSTRETLLSYLEPENWWKLKIHIFFKRVADFVLILITLFQLLLKYANLRSSARENQNKIVEIDWEGSKRFNSFYRNEGQLLQITLQFRFISL